MSGKAAIAAQSDRLHLLASNLALLVRRMDSRQHGLILKPFPVRRHLQ